MIIIKRPDGTEKFSGFVFEILDYTAKALNIRRVKWHDLVGLDDNEMIRNDNRLNTFILLFSYEFVFINVEYLKKYGHRAAQVYAIQNGVIIESHLKAIIICKYFLLQLHTTIDRHRKRISPLVVWDPQLLFTSDAIYRFLGLFSHFTLPFRGLKKKINNTFSPLPNHFSRR